MSGVIVFTGDMVIKQSAQGMLDRMSYSAVSVLKERTQLYDEDITISASQISTLNQIVEASLTRTMPSYDTSRFSGVYQQVSFSGDTDSPTLTETEYTQGGATQTCEPSNNLKSIAKSLSPITNEDRRAPLFQVTLCYRTDNWFGELVGEDYEWIHSNSIILGR